MAYVYDEFRLFDACLSRERGTRPPDAVEEKLRHELR